MSDEVVKRQHFLPCGYLKFFSVTGNWGKRRKTPVFFTDGKISKAVPVEKLGVEKYTYTKTDPEFEKQFEEMENQYPLRIERIIRGERKFSGAEYFQLLLEIIEFKFRSVVSENRTDEERKNIYTRMSKTFLYHFFSEVEGQGVDKEEGAKHLTKNWRIHIISPEGDEKFVTSDNPSTIYTNPKHDRPVMAYLPVHPRFALIAYDQRDIEVISEEATIDAVGVLNGVQVNRCVRQVYSDHDLSEDAESWKIVEELAKRAKPESWSDLEQWKPDFISIDEEVVDRFTFLRKREKEKGAVANAVRRALHDVNRP